MTSPLLQSCAKACGQVCAELSKVKRLQVEAQMATEVYNPSGERHVPGFDEVVDPKELEKLGLLPEDLSPTDSQFRAAVFKEADTGKYVVAFKGTTMNSRADWKANLLQGTTGYSDYYSRAKLIGRDVANATGADGVKFVGHSLGGGLASAAAHATGAPASTFNAAGLHLLNRNLFNPPPIDAVRVNGEILTGVQSAASRIPFIVPEASGTPYPIDPAPNVASTLSRVSLSGWDLVVPASLPYKYAKAAIARAVDLHLMSSVNPALQQRRDQLQEKADDAGCKC